MRPVSRGWTSALTDRKRRSSSVIHSFVITAGQRNQNRKPRKAFPPRGNPDNKLTNATTGYKQRPPKLKQSLSSHNWVNKNKIPPGVKIQFQTENTEYQQLSELGRTTLCFSIAQIQYYCTTAGKLIILKLHQVRKSVEQDPSVRTRKRVSPAEDPSTRAVGQLSSI
ncbi:hypothetical protein Tsp_03697 [Trichinella spiralis]|uniref:hypothetical protein n=1 Tax=Trichinella spiralis TaxID=6334 RepID=UPI0001EFB922|nr:hypothetical protein Tsp_03697 [Trichinella spiralis]